MANVLAKIASLHIEQTQTNLTTYMELCLCPPAEFKSNSHTLLKYLAL